MSNYVVILVTLSCCVWDGMMTMPVYNSHEANNDADACY